MLPVSAAEFDCNEIARVAESALPCFVLQPVRTDDGHEHLARRYPIVEV